MKSSGYPALYLSADQTSNEQQKLHLLLIRLEYGLLLLAAFFSMSQFSGAVFYTIYACIFMALIGVLLLRAFRRPVQHWYQARALAESAKTLTWRYMLRAPPFNGEAASNAAAREFTDHLKRLLRASSTIAEQGVPDYSANDQITAYMSEVRHSSFGRRKELYLAKRIQEQRAWYTAKAKYNRNQARNWIIAGVVSYAVAGALSLLRIWITDWQFWPIEPIIVFASSIIGWMQLKKFGELAAAYHVTAQEIGLLVPELDTIDSDDKFGEFVNDAELAFSREHTMWVARQTL